MLCVMMLTMAAYCTAQDFIVDGIKFTINYDNKTVSVARNGDANGILNIPETVTYNKKNYPVTKIGESAFKDCSELTQVNIPNSVTEIDVLAFYGCSGLTQVTVPKWLARDKKEIERVFPDFNGTVKVNSGSNAKSKKSKR